MTRSRTLRTRAAVLTAAVLAVVTLGTSGAVNANAMNPPQSTESGVVNLLAGTSAGSIRTFWATTMSAWGKQYVKPPLYYYNTSTYGFGTTKCGAMLRNNSFYCKLDNSIYLDYTWNQGLLNTYGDFGPGGILAHEWGHAIQAWLGYSMSDYRSEYHADCLAGMYVRYGYSTGRLNGSDYGEFYNWLYGQGYDVTHGRGTNRAAWYQYGYTQYSLAACNQAYSLSVTPAKAGTKQGVVGTSSGVETVVAGQTPPAPPVTATAKSRPSDGVVSVTLPTLTGGTLATLPAGLR